MTRETKIGLLVGLAFIIVIGILLSDHLTNSTEPPPAPMSQAGPSVRSGITTPIRQQQQLTETVPPQVQPNQPVPTANDLVPRPQPVKIVQVDAPGQNEPVTITTPSDDTPPQQPPQAATNRQVEVAAAPAESTPEPTPGITQPPIVFSQPVRQPAETLRTNDPVLSRLNQEAQKVGEMIVPVGKQPAATFTATRYKAEPGDTLSKIATKMYGSSSKAMRDAIIEANPSLKDNPNLVIEGRTYVIPAVNKPAAQVTEQGIAGSIASVRPPSATAIPPSGNGAVYIVQEGDNLTRIAIDQCGDETALAALKELNRDQLNGGDLIRPGMKLKLPARSVAMQ